jgi:hypothetical protein
MPNQGGPYQLDLTGNYFATLTSEAESATPLFGSLVVLRILKE